MSRVFDTPVAPISWGELIDKITILEIKKPLTFSGLDLKIISNRVLFKRITNLLLKVK
jgi:hypothetical protein